MRRIDLMSISAVIIIAVALLAFFKADSGQTNELSEVDFESFSYHPIEYQENDILSYNYHAFVRFQHPVVIGEEMHFLNIRVTNADNGEVAWLVKNLPIQAGQDPRPIHYRINTQSISTDDASPPVVLFEVLFEPLGGEFFQLTGDFVPDTVFTRIALPIQHTVPGGRRSDHFPTAIPYFGPVEVPLILPDTIKYLNRGCIVPNIDLDSTQNGDTNPDDNIGDGDLNSCGPAAAANSMKWLMETFDEIPDTLGLRDLLDSLEYFAKKIPDSIIIVPNADDPSINDTIFKPGGTYWHDIVRGKLQLIDKYRLPIRVKYQTHTPMPETFPEIESPDSTYGSKAMNKTGPTGIPDFDWICSELDHGEDVELDINYWCRDEDGDSMKFETGHFVNLIGYAKFGNARKLMWKHDIDQTKPGGTVEEWGCWEIAKPPNNNSETAPMYPVITEMSNTNLEGCVAYVGGAISESYDPTVRFCPKNIGKGDDSGQNSLREAVLCARSGDTITLTHLLGGDTITLTSAPIKIDSNITICADPADMVHVKADNIARAFEIAPGASVEFKGFAIIGGTNTEGSAIKISGALVLKDIVVFPGTADAGEQIILNNGDLEVRGFTNIKD